MILNKRGPNTLNINSSFSSRKISEEKIKTEAGIIIGASGNPFLLERISSEKNYTSENLYLDFVANPANGEVTECSVITKSQFSFQDESFHNPVLLFKNDKKEGINGDILYKPLSYGHINIQLIEELVDNPTRFFVKVSNFDTFSTSTSPKDLFVGNYIQANAGLKILGVTKNKNSQGVFEYADSLELISEYERGKINFETSSYFVPLAIIDTDRKNFTVLY